MADEQTSGGAEQNKGEGEGGDRKQKPPARWPWIAGSLIVVVFVSVVLWQVFAPHPDVWTDDAYVSVHYATVSPRIAGQVIAVHVDDNQTVRAGDLLVELDPRDNQAALDLAQAELERDTAQVADASANVARQPAIIAEQAAQVASAQARLSFAVLDQRRYTNLASTGAGTAQEHQQAEATMRQDHAALDQAEAALEASRRQMQVLEATRSSSDSTVEADKVRIRQARLNVDYTRLYAPIDGMIGQKTVQTGNIVSPGVVLMAVVPLNDLFITANYREVDLRHVRRGQRVTVHADAYDIDLDGVVDSVPPASGAAFAPIPPNNATGNFTKIVQRLPVKITLAPGQRLAALLRIGFSVETTIHTGLADVVAEQQETSGRVTAP